MHFYLSKTLLVMKLTAILLLISFLQVKANVTVAQNKITLVATNQPLSKIFKEIEKQTGYIIWCDKKLLQGTKNVTIHLINAPIEEALSDCLKGESLKFTILEKNIVISSEVAISDSSTIRISLSSYIDVHGKVFDENNKPAQGVTVSIKESKTMTVTDENGEFSLKNVAKNAILIFSSVNMEAFEVRVDGKMDLV